MSNPFTNTHMHVFNTSCAPDNFLRVVPIPTVRKNPKTIKRLLDSKIGRAMIDRLFKWTNGDESMERKEWKKYISFLQMGTEKTQLSIFMKEFEVARMFDTSPRVVGLTLNMDYMDNDPSSSHKRIETQLEEVMDIKRYLPHNFFPFLGVDPRFKAGRDLKQWCFPYTEVGIEKDGVWYPFFAGIKIYPALGYFPFDPRLADVYAYAEEKGLPVMTHCTRSGSQYIGNNIESLISKTPEMIMPAGAEDLEVVRAIQQKTYDRIGVYYDRKWIKNNNIGDNDEGCDIFGHPENYIPLLRTYPKLRLCLAHMGGSSEIYATDKKREKNKLGELQKEDGGSWFDILRNMMVEYPNLYTDISYTLSDLDLLKEGTTDNYIVMDRMVEFFDTMDKNGKPLSERVLFGTDFFMTEQEKKESQLFQLANQKLGKYMNQIAKINPAKYLQQPVYQ